MKGKSVIFLLFTLFMLSIQSTYAWLGLFAQDGDIISPSRWNSMITTLHTKLDQSSIQGSTNIEVNNSGTGVILTFTGGLQSNPIPEISTTTQTLLGTSTTTTIIIEGDDFIPSSTVTIPGFSGTINSVSVPSQSRIEINLTSSTTTGVYDIVVSNNGVLNTLWTGNGGSLLNVTNTINIVGTDTPGREYSDGSYATSCNGYRNPSGTYLYSGNIGNGYYIIKPDNNTAFRVYCDMTTTGGGWTRIEYSADLAHQAQFGGVDTNLWLPNDFTFTLSESQINAIRSISTQGKQTYHGTCQGVIHHNYQTANYAYAFGFRFHQGHETAFNQQTYPSSDITVVSDGCVVNNGNILSMTEFDVIDIRVPIINVHSRDNSSTEQFGSPLTSYPAWFK